MSRMRSGKGIPARILPDLDPEKGNMGMMNALMTNVESIPWKSASQRRLYSDSTLITVYGVGAGPPWSFPPLSRGLRALEQCCQQDLEVTWVEPVKKATARFTIKFRRGLVCHWYLPSRMITNNGIMAPSSRVAFPTHDIPKLVPRSITCLAHTREASGWREGGGVPRCCMGSMPGLLMNQKNAVGADLMKNLLLLGQSM